MIPDTPTATEHPFDLDTQVIAISDHRFQATLSDRWNALGGVVNGGYYVAVCLRALQRVLPHPDPLAVSTFFLRRAVPGPVEVDTGVARQGRGMSTGEARLYQDGEEVVRTTATYADLDRSQGPTAVLASEPDLPPPELATDPIGDAAIPGVSLTGQVEYRFPTLPGWWQGRPTGDPTMELWMRFKGRRDADPFSLPFLVDGAAPVVMDLHGVAGSRTLQLTTHVRRRPAPGWLACRIATRYLIDGYHEEDFEIWDSQNNLVAQARQLARVVTS